MSINIVFDKLWNDYITINPNVKKIHDLFTAKGETVSNDHIALRTFNDPRVNIEKVAAVLLKNGYVECGTYNFKAKHLFAKHFEHPESPDLPKVFISELLLEEFSAPLQSRIKAMIDAIPADVIASDEFIFSGRAWKNISFAIYEELREESEYAAWVYAYGYRANHFTVSVDKLKHFETIESVNEFIKANGFKLNDVGGEIKGSPQVYLEQSSTLANSMPIVFTDGTKEIPSVFYEFATRYHLPNGEVFRGFIAENADKIFESTNFVTT